MTKIISTSKKKKSKDLTLVTKLKETVKIIILIAEKIITVIRNMQELHFEKNYIDSTKVEEMIQGKNKILQNFKFFSN